MLSQILNKYKCFGLFVIISLVLAPSPGLAQNIIPVPNRPGNRIEPTPLPPVQQPLPTPSQPTETPVEQPESDVVGTIKVEKFEFVGNTVFSQEQLNEITAQFLGQPLTFAQLLQVADRISQFYIQQGYITSGAYIPNQELESGTVRIQIVEGTLEEIKVNIAEGRLTQEYISSRLKAFISTPLNIRNLQQALQLLQLNPLIERIDADLSSGSRPGSNTLEVTVIGAKTFTLTPFLNNNRNPSVGSFERGINLTQANLLGFGDELGFTYANTDGSNRFEVSYVLPVNPYNGTVEFYYRTTSNTIIEPPFDQLDIDIDYYDYLLTYRQPVIQRADAEGSQELALGVSISRRESDSRLDGQKFPLSAGANEEGEVRLSAISFSQEWTSRSREDVIAARSEFDIGVGLFDATISDSEPDSGYFLWRGQFAYLRLLSPPAGTPAVGTTLLLRSDIQLASSPLLPLEQFSLGGQSTVRGYRQDAIVTDNGVFLSAEVRIPILRVPEVEGNLQIAPFIDFGTGWNVDSQNDELEDTGDNTLLGMGFGLLWQMGNNFSARFDFGFPLISIDDEGDRTWQENGIYFQIDYNWRPF